MAFDESGFRAAAKAAGHSDDEINAVVSKEAKGNKDTFVKGPQGYQLGTIEQANKDLGNDWWHLPVAFGAGGAAVAGAKSLLGKPTEAPARIEPTMAPYTPVAPTAPSANVPPVGGTPLTLEQAASRLQQITPPAAVAPPPVTPPPVAPSPVEPLPQIIPTTPVEVADNMVAGETPSQAKVTTAPQKAAELATKVASKTGIIPPQDQAFQYKKSAKTPIGPGAYNWLAGQEGPKAPEVWKNIVGEKNIPYAEIKDIYSSYQAGYGEPDPFQAVSKQGEYRKPVTIPKEIKGAVSPEMLNSLLNKANVAAALMAPSAAQAPTVQDYSKLQGGRGTVNPPNVDPRDWGRAYSELLKMIQGVTGGTSQYVSRQ